MAAEWPIGTAVALGQVSAAADATWTGRRSEGEPRTGTEEQSRAVAGQALELSVEQTEMMLRVSRLIEDDPKLAVEFARSLQLDTTTLRGLEAVCVEGEKADICPPTTQQLRQVCAASALPFLGFGMLDNAVMIVFGDFIDLTLCATCGFSTMAAAALGNTMSDGFGVFSGGVVEDMAAKAGFEAPPLSRAQQALASTKRWERLGQLGGITVGCLIGMFPLLLINWKDQEAQKRDKFLEHMYEHVVVAVEEMLIAEAAVIAFVDEEKGEIYSRSAAYHGDKEFDVRMPIGEGIMGKVAQTGNFLNIADVRSPQSAEYYNEELHENFCNTGVKVRSVLCMPVLGHNPKTGKYDKVVGVVGVVNKKDGGHFSEKDEDALAALCSHISTSLGFVHGEEHGFDEALDRCARALRMKGTRINAASNQRVHDLYTMVLAEVCKLVEVDTAELLSVNVERMEVMHLASSFDDQGRELTNDSDDKVMAFEDAGIVAEVAASGRACAIAGNNSSELCCPLLDGSGEVIGAIRVTSKDASRVFTDKQTQDLESVGKKVSLTMEGTGSSLTRLLQSLQSE